MQFHKILRNGFITVFILLFCTLVSYLFTQQNIRIENIIMFYLCGVLLIEIMTRSFFWGMCGSVLSIIIFNFCFTQPILSFEIYDPNYIITLFVFLVVSFITGSLAHQMQQHAKEAKLKEKQTAAMYTMSTEYLNMNGVNRILQHHMHTLFQTQHIQSYIYYYNMQDKLLKRYEMDDLTEAIKPDDTMARWCFEHFTACGFSTSHFPNHDFIYLPMLKNEEMLGVCAIYQYPQQDEDKKRFINTMLSLLVMALERERLYEEQENNRIAIEKEKLRNQLLRSISHDLRTPLTSIAGSSSLMITNQQDLSEDTKINLLKSISSDALWLTQLVENLLHMTRIQDGRLMIKKQLEVVDDIICEAAQRCESRIDHHILDVHLPDSVILVNMDGRLIIQVLVNMIDNAIKHTFDESHIDITFHQSYGQAYFEVIDNGEGIDDEVKDKLFDSFVTTKADQGDAKRGIGLGLSICKAIIEAHDGKIYAYNRNDAQGALFGFSLPYKEDAYE